MDWTGRERSFRKHFSAGEKPEGESGTDRGGD